MANLSNRWFLNNLDLYDTFGLTIEDGSKALQTPFEPKERLMHDWPEEDGIDVDAEPVKYKAKEVTLKVRFLVYTEAEYHSKREAFITEISKPGWHEYRVTSHNKTYSVLFMDAKGGEIDSNGFQNRAFIAFSFDLVLLVQPVLMPAQNWQVTVNLNGVFYAYGAPGSTVNVITSGGGTTPTVSINSVLHPTGGKTITINASSTSGYTIQYSINGGQTYQNYNVFDPAPNGTYGVNSIIVRLAEAPTITAKWNQIFTINYVPPEAAETVNIDNVTVYQDRITVLASKANTTKLIEYSLNGSTYQASNVFTAVPNGSYSNIKVRLVGSTITDTWGASVTVNHTVTTGSFNTVLAHRQSADRVTFYAPSNGLTNRFHFNVPLPTADPFPASMTMYRNGSVVGRIDFLAPAIGQDAALEIDGVLYPVKFQNNDNVTL